MSYTGSVFLHLLQVTDSGLAEGCRNFTFIGTVANLSNIRLTFDSLPVSVKNLFIFGCAGRELIIWNTIDYLDWIDPILNNLLYQSDKVN
jgi:hypothetical protein